MSILDEADLELITMEAKLDDMAAAAVPLLDAGVPRVMVAAQYSASLRMTRMSRDEMANALAAAVLVLAERKGKNR